jgi:hypothetical protein
MRSMCRPWVLFACRYAGDGAWSGALSRTMEPQEGGDDGG